MDADRHGELVTAVGSNAYSVATRTATRMKSESAPENSHYHSHLFVVRVWREELGGGQLEWRCKAQHIPSGEIRYLREWTMLLAFLQEMLSGELERTAKT